MSAPSVLRLPAGAVVLTGDAVRLVVDALGVFAAQRRLNGLPGESEARRLSAFLSGVGRPDSPEEPSVESEPMTTQQLAEALGCSARNAQRLARRLDGRQIGGRWLVPRRAVAEHLEGMRDAAYGA